MSEYSKDFKRRMHESRQKSARKEAQRVGTRDSKVDISDKIRGEETCLHG